MRQSLASRAWRSLGCAARPPRCATGYRSFSSTLLRSEEQRKWSTPLAKQLFEAMQVTGPVPLASYMRMCLTGDLGGYYTGKFEGNRDQFGTKGDFITSPEISQIFGELIGIWCIAEWMSQGMPSKGVQLIEVGPGRGTLMDDVLRTIQRFPAMTSSIESIIMVEASKELQQTQQRLLCGTDSSAADADADAGLRGLSKYGKQPITWASSLKSVPIEPTKFPLIIAHEFFDALPIHTFQTGPAAPKPASKSAKSQESTTIQDNAEDKPQRLEWRELMVAATRPTAAGSAGSSETPVPEFQLVLSNGTTRHSQYLPDSSERYHTLSQVPSATIEVCPDAHLYATDFSTRIGGSNAHPKPKPSGAALILDYGTAEAVPAHSLRGIKHHRMVNPFSEPGLVDLSADVDFTAIADTALAASEGVEVHGPVQQADFLESMGIRERAMMLTRQADVSSEIKERTEKSCERLVDRGPEGMGKIYKVLAILPENGGRRRPAGFGGDVGSS